MLGLAEVPASVMRAALRARKAFSLVHLRGPTFTRCSVGSPDPMRLPVVELVLC